MFGTAYDTSADKFQNYYKDVSLRLKNRELDMVIVVGMFLTGFDATTLNTLWVDKNLKSHGLVQAFSRTNRVLNSVKAYGNIVAFRDLRQATDDAIALFGNKDAGGIVLLKPYAEYLTEYAKNVSRIKAEFPQGEPIVGESAQKAFIKLFGTILRLRNILTSFDEFSDDDAKCDSTGDPLLLTDRAIQDYTSTYLDLRDQLRKPAVDKESILDDVVFELELVKQVEINVDYILMLVEQYRAARGDGEDKEIKAKIDSAINSSPSLRNKKDLIDAFVDRIGLVPDTAQSHEPDVVKEWQDFVTTAREAELARIIAEENLRPAAARTFIDEALREGKVKTTGTAVSGIIPPTSRFTPTNDHAAKKQSVIDRLTQFVTRYFDIT